MKKIFLFLMFLSVANAKEIPVDQNTENILKNHPTPIILIFSEKWCIECKLAKPFINQLKQQKDFDIVILEGTPRSLQIKFNLKGFPSFFLVKNGKIYDSIVGYGNSDIFNVNNFKKWTLQKGK